MTLISFLLLVACSCSGPQTSPEASTPEETMMQKPPFGAKQIRDAQWVGKTTVHRIDEKGREPYLRVTKWVEVEEEHAAFQAIELDLEQRPIGEPMTAKATWGELVEHALFPAEVTTVSETTTKVPAGTYDGWLYTVSTREDGHEVLSKFYFARELPGPPVRMERWVDGERVYLMELVDPDTREAASAASGRE